MSEAYDSDVNGANMEIATEIGLDDNGVAVDEFPAETHEIDAAVGKEEDEVDAAVTEEEGGDGDGSPNVDVNENSKPINSTMENDESPTINDSKTTNEIPPREESITAVSDASKPLKSILKKRKPDPECLTDVPGEKADPEPTSKIPKGGSITQALKLLTGYAKDFDEEADSNEPKDFDEEIDSNEPKPSAFVLEMERQKAVSTSNPGAMNLPAGYGVSDSSTNNHYFNQFHVQVDDEKGKQDVAVTGRDSDVVAKPALTQPDPVKSKEKCEFEAVLLINNLPFKVTTEEILTLLGVGLKNGKDAVRIITDRSTLPTGYAYVIVDDYSDMSSIWKMSGVTYKGRRLRVTKSKRDNLINDWRMTKIALAERDKSRVVCVKHLPFVLTKSELISILHEVKIDNEDIYWSPLRKNQTNSGRGFVVLRSCEDAKKLNDRSFSCSGMQIHVMQVHPGDFHKFMVQCNLILKPGTCICDDVPPDAGDVSDLDLDFEKPSSPDAVTSVRQYRSLIEHPEPYPNNKGRRQDNFPNPNMVATPFVRLFHTPGRTTTADIQSYFAPLKPAKITQNIASNIWDVEFFNPADGMQAMKKDGLMMRKNVIRLQMLPGPPQPLSQNHFSGPMPPGFVPPGMPMMMHQPAFHGMMNPGMMPPGPGVAPMFHPGMPNPGPAIGRHPMHMQPPIMPQREFPRWHPPNSFLNPNTTAPPLNSNNGPTTEDRKRENSESRETRRRQKSPSPENPPPPKKELIPVPPMPDDFTTYVIPPFDGETPVGQAIICPMQGYFCQLCNKFYSTKVSAKDTHCKTKGHYDKLKQILQEKKRLRKLAEAEHSAKR